MGKRLKLKESLEKNVGKIGEKKVEKKFCQRSLKKIETVEKKLGQNLKKCWKNRWEKSWKKVEKKVSC